MARRSSRTLGFLAWMLILLWGSAASDASQIRLKSGYTYSNVTVLRRDATSILIQVQYGTMTLPLTVVDRIDGVPVAPTPPPPPPRPTLDAAPAVQPVMPPATEGEPPGASAQRAATPAASPSAVPVKRSAPVPTPAPASSPSDAPSWWNIMPFGRNGWIGLAVFVVLMIWLDTLPKLGRDLRERRVKSSAWPIVALLLPAVGYWLYLGSRQLGASVTSWRRKESADTEVLVFLDADYNPISIDPGGAVATGIENARAILENALLKRASDVHIEPVAQEYRVRLRVDGTMLADRTLSTAAGARLVSAIKIIAQLNAAERRKAQDGRFGARRGERAVDFRVATAPSMHGEMLVLRILDRKAGVRGLDALGMPQEMMDHFAQIVHSRSGMILATGPTGSGKTSTLYSALGQLDASQLKLLTIEDPVEYELAGATQIPVNPKAGVSYESGLRSILRLDPDVILVGEMRDLESAQIALRAALTGHLVFSSLHTRDAVGAVMRLEEMGIEPHLVASALFVVLSQRLVRVLCEACREPYTCTGSELLGIGIELTPGETLHRAVGCRRCEGTGYQGRTAIFEMLVLDQEIRQSINGGIDEDGLLKLAREKGFASYREDGAMKALLGVTTVEEVIQAN